MAAPMGLSSHTCSLSATGLMTKKKKKQPIKKRQCDITEVIRSFLSKHVKINLRPFERTPSCSSWCLSSSVQVLSDVHAARYIHGVALHWYFDRLIPPQFTLDVVHRQFPEYYLFSTEACAGFNPVDRGVNLGRWSRAEDYTSDILEVRTFHLSEVYVLVQSHLQWLR